MSRFLDDALDDDDDDGDGDAYGDDDAAYDALKDDGWTNADILHRRHIVGGRYVGPKDDQQEPDDAA